MDFSLSEQWILHVDMDAFFASIEELDHPEYINRPLVVGADPENGKGRGVVSTCNYAARRYKIHSAMPISRAYSLCPHAVFLSPRMKRYEEISSLIKNIFHEFSPSVESLSLDEAFLDISGMQNLFSSPEDLAMKLKNKIFSETGLTASAGISKIKFIAKIASDMNKPDGLTLCPPGKEKEFISNLAVEKLPGVGKKTKVILNEMGIYNIKQLSITENHILFYRLKNSGLHLKDLSLGLDRSAVSAEERRKSIGEETTFREDTNDPDFINKILKTLSDTLSVRIKKEKLAGFTITLKIRLEGFSTYTRSRTLKTAISSANDILKHAENIFHSFHTGEKLIRLLGISLSNLQDVNSSIQPDLFSYRHDDKTEKMEIALSSIKRKFGSRVKKGLYLS